jgi:hypothetical protein
MKGGNESLALVKAQPIKRVCWTKHWFYIYSKENPTTRDFGTSNKTFRGDVNPENRVLKGHKR